MNTWKNISSNSDFSIHNIPFGIVSKTAAQKMIVSRIGDDIIDLSYLHDNGYFDSLNLPKDIFKNQYLNPFISLGKNITNKVRKIIQDVLIESSNAVHAEHFLIPISDVIVHLPVQVGDYTDFYSSIEHATNVGKMFRDPENALLPNWKHLPVGYHGRSSSIVVSGTDIKRPYGQIKPNDGHPIFGPTTRLDFELEMAFIIGKDSQIGSAISTDQADEYIFGMVLFNDWSARDIQKWEYVPLGPFLGKNFASSISPWVVTLEALQPFAVKGPDQDPPVLEYLQYKGDKNYDISLEVSLQPAQSSETCICKSNYKYMYWNMTQQLAHHTINGCNVRVGDMMASGTISGKTPDSFGSMLELSWAGQKPIKLSSGEERKFIEDGDTITMRGFGEKDGLRVGFGEVSGKIIN